MYDEFIDDLHGPAALRLRRTHRRVPCHTCIACCESHLVSLSMCKAHECSHGNIAPELLPPRWQGHSPVCQLTSYHYAQQRWQAHGQTTRMRADFACAPPCSAPHAPADGEPVPGRPVAPSPAFPHAVPRRTLSAEPDLDGNAGPREHSAAMHRS